MKLIVFGASGKTGRHIVQQALDAGHTVTAFVRNPAAFEVQHTRLNVVQGDILDATSVDRALPGHNAVLSALGTKTGERAPVLSQGMGHIIAAMKRHGVRRLIVESSIAMPDNKPYMDFSGRVMTEFVSRFVLRAMWQDKMAMEALIQESGLDSVIVRPITLTTGPYTGHYQHGIGLPVRMSSKISRADVADFMLRQLADTVYLHQKPSLIA
jgi:putative NADH-flavin reductase